MIFADDLKLCAEVAERHGPLRTPIVEAGGLPRPCVAAYDKTIQAMQRLAVRSQLDSLPHLGEVIEAQKSRYQDIEMPLSFLGEYTIENPELGGLPLERLAEKYPRTIGTAILLSVLEHVANPFLAIEKLHGAMMTGGLVVCSVPFTFPWHPGSGEDNFRFTPTGLRHVFGDEKRWEILECAFRIDHPAEAGVIDLSTGRSQIIQSAYLCARAK